MKNTKLNPPVTLLLLISQFSSLEYINYKSYKRKKAMQICVEHEKNVFMIWGKLKTNEITEIRINKNVSYNLEIQVTLLKNKTW